GTVAIHGGNLARIEAADWARVRALGSRIESSSDALEPFRREFELGAIAVARSDGTFGILEARGALGPRHSWKLFDIVALRESSLPFRVGTQALEAGAEGVRHTGDLPLFPAARDFVSPILDPSLSVSVSPGWVLEPTSRDELRWVGSLERFAGPWDSPGIPYATWLVPNQAQPVIVPADVPLRLEHETPYHENFSPA